MAAGWTSCKTALMLEPGGMGRKRSGDRDQRSVYEDDIARCLAVGFSAHVAKPFDEDGLVSVIAEVIGQASQQGARAVGNGASFPRSSPSTVTREARRP